VLAFGLLNVIGSVLTWSEMTVPGTLVGIVWAVFGWKGLPILPSGPVSAEPDSIARALRVIRRRRVLGFLLPFLGVPIVVFGFGMFGPAAGGWLMGPLAVLGIISVGLSGLSGCPRCGLHYSLSGKRVGYWGGKCVHCGLPLNG
jgi:hypothetical protein